MSVVLRIELELDHHDAPANSWDVTPVTYVPPPTLDLDVTRALEPARPRTIGEMTPWQFRRSMIAYDVAISVAGALLYAALVHRALLRRLCRRAWRRLRGHA